MNWFIIHEDGAFLKRCTDTTHILFFSQELQCDVRSPDPELSADFYTPVSLLCYFKCLIQKPVLRFVCLFHNTAYCILYEKHL